MPARLPEIGTDVYKRQILELREQTGIRFFYSIDKIKAIDHLSIAVKNEVLKDVLSRLLGGKGLTYTLLDLSLIHI